MRRVAALGLALICSACGSGTEVGGDLAGTAAGQELLEIDEMRSAASIASGVTADKGGSEVLEQETQDGEPGKLVLWDLRSSGQGIVIRIYSEGCTSRGDIKVVVYESLPPKLLFLRATPDRCERGGQFPNGVELSFTWAELGIKQRHGFKVLNRLEARGY